MIPISTFGERLKRARLDAGLTQEALANKCGMKKQNISRYEKSDREPNIRTAKCLAEALGTSLEYLVENRLNQFDIQFFTENPAAKSLTPKQAEFIRLLDQVPPEMQDSVIDRLEDIVQLLLSRGPR